MFGIIFGFIASGLLVRWFYLLIFDAFFKEKEDEKYTYIDNSTHNYYYDNRTAYLDGNVVTPNRDKVAVDID